MLSDIFSAKMIIRKMCSIYATIAVLVCYYNQEVTAASVLYPEQRICNKLNSTISWRCTQKSECKWREEFHLYRRDVTCSVNGQTKERKICCPLGQRTATEVSAGWTTTTPKYALKPSTTDKSPASIVSEKCLEYANYRYSNKTVIRKLVTDSADKKYKMELDCPTINPLIIGGEAAKQKEYPHMALIGYKEDFDDLSWNCGGSLISEQFIMSAAHCGEPSALGKATWALLGMLSKENFSPSLLNKNLFRIVQRFIHPEYKGPKMENNDIALFKLEKPITLSPSIRPVCLSTTEVPTNSVKQSTVTGWGVVGYGEAESETLQKATIHLLSNELCTEAYKDERRYENGFDPKTMVCAGHLTLAKDTCVGDSGGPLQVPLLALSCMWTQVGITSFGAAFCGNNVPAVYTKVANFIPWIQKIVWPQS